MTTLVDLRARGILPSWQQTVAIVQELILATVSERGTVARLPDVAHIGLNPDGTIALLPHSSIPENPVRHLAVVLGVLLENVPAPAPLLDLVERNLKDPPELATADELTRALRYFERPGRDEDIKEIGERAEQVREQKPIEEAQRQLEERARELLECQEMPERHILERDGTVTVVKRERAPRLPAISTTELPSMEEGPPTPSKWDVHGTLRLAIMFGAVAFAAHWIGREGTPSRGPDSVEEKIAGAARRVFGDSAGGGAPTSGPSADRPPASAPLPSSGPATGSSGTSAASSSGPSSGPTSSSTPPASAGASGSGTSQRPADGTAAPPDTGLPAVEGGPITGPTARGASGPSEATFSSGDADVSPPVLLSREQPAAGAGASVVTYQLVVDPSGSVEQVRLISGEGGMRESMMRAHVKSWKFRPATRNGQPVRYRMQVSVTIIT